MALTNDIVYYENQIVARIQRGIDRLAELQRRRAVYRQTYAELSAMSLRELGEIGIRRGDISAIARDAADRA